MNQPILLVHINIEGSFCVFFSAFRCFFIISSLLNVLFMIFLIFSKISIYWIKTFPFLLKNKCICFHQKFFYFILCQRHMHKDLNSPEIFVTNETFKILFTKRKLIRLYYFINIYIVYPNRQISKYRNRLFWWNCFSSTSVSSNFIFSKFIFVSGLKFFITFLIYNFLLFNLNQVFKAKFRLN